MSSEAKRISVSTATTKAWSQGCIVGDPEEKVSDVQKRASEVTTNIAKHMGEQNIWSRCGSAAKRPP